MDKENKLELIESESNFFIYFAEIRKYLIQILLFLLILFIALSPFSKEIYQFLAQPLLSKLPTHAHMIATDITSTFVAPFKLVFFLTLIISIPFIFFKIYSFIQSAVYQAERRVFFIFLLLSILLFYFGFFVGYYFILPKILEFFLSVAPDSVIPMTDINQYLVFCIKLFLILGLIFQLPLMIFLLIYLNVVERQKLAEKRVFVFIFCFFVAMFITPPDILSMSIGGIMMYMLFELGMLISLFITYGKKR